MGKGEANIEDEQLFLGLVLVALVLALVFASVHAL